MSDRRAERWTNARLAVTAGALALAALPMGHQISLVTADLGRHLRNGEVFFQSWRPIATNFYSYTLADRPVVNHHWGAGVVFYLLWRAAGFEGLQLLHFGLALAALWIALAEAFRKARWPWVAVAAALALPCMAQRLEVRPETFSNLLTLVFFQRLLAVRDGRSPVRSLWLLPALEALWVNLHIYFALGPALIGAFAIDCAVSRDRRDWLPIAVKVFAATAAATLLNPWGLRGALQPFLVTGDYGYRLVENQSVFFLQSLAFAPERAFLELTAAATAAALAAAWARRRAGAFETLVAAALGASAVFAVRNAALFGLISIPVLACCAQAAAADVAPAIWLRRAGGAAAAVLLAAFFPTRCGPFADWARPWGLGLERGDGLAASFLGSVDLQGPVYNDYDIGGYLIFYLFPRVRVFVDNRPEAYGKDFFDRLYVPMQSDESVWRAVDAQIRFDAVVFNRRDATPWGQAFLIRRVFDPAWAPVFVDERAIVLLRRTQRHRATIARFELPRSMFRVSRGW